MASSRVSATTSRKSGNGSSRERGSSAELTVSNVRWAGVALVIAALLGAITLAVISPSDPTGVAGSTVTQPAAEATVEPDLRVPDTEVRIISPIDGITTVEREMVIAITVLPYELPKGALTLQVYRNGEAVRGGSQARPAADDIDVGPIRLVEGRNEITAALTTSGGAGPTSAPVVIIVDKIGPDITVVSPESGARVFTRKIDVTGTSDVGALVTAHNNANDFERSETVGPSGTFEILVNLVAGKNKIVIRATDPAGNKTKPAIRRDVVRVDPVPRVKLTLSQKALQVSSLPKRVRATVNATDSTGSPLEKAEVIFTVSVPDQGSRTKTVRTDADGQARWQIEITPGGARRGEAQISVEVKANGESETKSKVLILK